MDCAQAEALHGGEDVVCGLGPAEGLGIGIVGVDAGADVAFEGTGRAVNPAPDLLVGQECEEALDLIDP